MYLRCNSQETVSEHIEISEAWDQRNFILKEASSSRTCFYA